MDDLLANRTARIETNRRFLPAIIGASFVVLGVILVLVIVNVARGGHSGPSSSSLVRKLTGEFAPVYAGVKPRVPPVFNSKTKVNSIVIFGDEMAAGEGAGAATHTWADQALEMLYEYGLSKKSAIVYVYATAGATSADLDAQYAIFRNSGHLPPSDETLFVVQSGVHDLATDSAVATAARVAEFAQGLARDDKARRVVVFDYANACQIDTCRVWTANVSSDYCAEVGPLSDNLLAYASGIDFAVAPLNFALYRHGQYRYAALSLTPETEQPRDVWGQTMSGLLADPFFDSAKSCVELNQSGQSVQAQLLTAFVLGKNFYPVY